MRFFFFLLLLPLFFALVRSVSAIYDPTTVPNNKIGIHILFPGEVHDAAKLVNNQDKGAWGYVTIPIQSTDRDRPKWQNFFEKCKEAKIIPIVRLATSPNGSNWERPNIYELIDFANFLNDFEWPVQNRYIIVYNEVNRPDEYGGAASPEHYADILAAASEIFKNKSEDFFILPAGLDNAAITQNGAVQWKSFLTRMQIHRPGIFDRIDGWNSHAYPNPDFSVRPDQSGGNKIDSFNYDLAHLKKYTQKKLPVFITETGWSNKYLPDVTTASYYKYAFSKVWSNPIVVSITPFLLNAQDGPFKQFSFLGENQNPKEFFETWSALASTGEPPKSQKVEVPSVASANEPQAILGTNTNSMESLEDLYSKLKTILGITE